MTLINEASEPKRGFGNWVAGWVRWCIGVAIVVAILGTVSQYMQLRQDAQDQTISILAGAGLKYSEEGINLPIGIMAAQSVTARVLMKDAAGSDHLVAVRVTPIGIPFTSILNGYDSVYYSISGPEMLRLKGGIN